MGIYLYDNPVITMNDWLPEYGNEWSGHLDKDLYNAFKKHPMRTLDPEKAEIFIIAIPMLKLFNFEKENYINKIKTAILEVVNND